MKNQTECTKKIAKVPTNGHKNTDNTTRAIIVHESVKNGTSQVDIAKKVGVSKDVVKRVLQSYKKTGTHMAAPRSGRPLKLNERDKRGIMLQISRDPTQPMNKIAKALPTPVSDKTLRKFLRNVGVYSPKMIQKPKISEINSKGIAMDQGTSIENQ
ncbi:Homeodomain-like DNA binding domain-containing transcription factor [Phycomyces blakesleeanus NRRL 1555(-)]|uniref:Homeodomain-like DNA binding domain-containing transcription factor n=1 Tax=Phycomyces blakesleeanus (strain ATCC 8743b / DSM 1359 / FGSC 10004 / NBRC 33097 / NRRL 1555) TaxID=763407 RepID=A0A167KNK4_PHYB8|nr:Homeodomain-like DNA binding domain-containing transcription factor [Phycomyces blakesleeanus NRRL 1555(-)]OAD68506.1 Homeodomain-like DNA binding domain-containing transcription factor [Phycomyces blakesleeanus NRRL 1555(-)]|eukprot:XP_018286546.1 Homeodomain-like DNA binding domain-containing transcription factor [Phycomyces blakesleeanus NRRL 1555(-)]